LGDATEDALKHNTPFFFDLEPGDCRT
jgi:hypothetical protein